MQVIIVNHETWIICGGRNFADQEMFDRAMRDIIELRGIPGKVVHGGATGADQMAGKWADRKAVDCVVVKADWGRPGRPRRAAGPERNQSMLDKFKPKRLVAFPGGRGTADMIRRATAAGVEVIEVRPYHEISA